MKKAPAASVTPEAPDFSSLEALRGLADLLEQRRTLEERVAQIPAALAEAREELGTLDKEIGEAEVSLLTLPDKQVPAAIKRRDALEAKQVECALRIRRLEVQLSAIEATAPDLDSKIELEIGAIRIEASIASETVQVALAEDIRQSVSGLRVLYAKVRALQRLVPTARTGDFLLDAYIPDLESCMRVNTGTGHYNSAPNLLQVIDPETQQAEAEIAEMLRPITDALVASRKHVPYVPLAKRPQPYVFKGSNEGPARGNGGPIGQPGPPPQMVEEKPVFNGYKTNEPYEVKGDMSGRRTREAAAAEMDIGRSIMRAAESADR